MLPAKPQILECPHCGGLRRINAIMSGNTFGMTQWSDAKRCAPMLPTPSLVMRCPHCSKYHFFEPKQILGSCNVDGHSSWGNLSYASLKEALVQLQPTGLEELNLRIMLIHAYNDLYGGCPGTMQPEEAPAHERLYFERNARKLIAMHGDNMLFCAELYRELGEYDQAREMLSNITGDDYMLNIARQIDVRAERGDSRVFVLNDNNGQQRLREAILVDDVAYKYDPKRDVERRRKGFIEWLQDKFNPLCEESEF